MLGSQSGPTLVRWSWVKTAQFYSSLGFLSPTWPQGEPRLLHIFEVVSVVIYHHTFSTFTSLAELRKKAKNFVLKCPIIVEKKKRHIYSSPLPTALYPDVSSLIYVTSLAPESIGERDRGRKGGKDQEGGREKKRKNTLENKSVSDFDLCLGQWQHPDKELCVSLQPHILSSQDKEFWS